MNGEKEDAFEHCEDAELCGIRRIVEHEERSRI